jgi:hypothetical protein
VFFVVGALVFGEALHVSLVEGTQPFVSRPVLGALVLGSVFIGLGYVLREEPVPKHSARDDVQSEPASDETPGDDEYDPRLSPLGNEPSETRGDDDDRVNG